MAGGAISKFQPGMSATQFEEIMGGQSVKGNTITKSNTGHIVPFVNLGAGAYAIPLSDGKVMSYDHTDQDS